MSRQLCTIHRLTPFSVAIGLPWPVERILPKQVRWKDHVRMKFWAWDEKELPSITHAIRTAVATTVSVVIAQLIQMPEAYWAAIATLVVVQSTLGATLTLSIAFRLEKTAYHYASITLTIIVLIPRLAAPWSIALHRFIEVSVGIIVALTVVAVWPERRRLSPNSTAE